MATDFDVAVVGGGIAGVSAAQALSDTHRVILLEREANLAHHSTGRSAAVFVENYGAPAVRPLTRFSRDFFMSPPRDLVEGPLTTPRGALWIALRGHLGDLDTITAEGEATGVASVALSVEEVCERVPLIRRDRIEGGLLEPEPRDIDVAATHQAYVRGLRRNGGEILTSSPVSSLSHGRAGWTVTVGERSITASVLVNAAGAWGDVVAALADIKAVGLVPMRRTAFMVNGDPAWSEWPMVFDTGLNFYFKADGSQILCSPADETPTTPGDARPDLIDVARAIERINETTDLAIRSVRSEWAGLRTFAPDRAMVIGPDPANRDFFWLVGQGGTGIQTAPGAAALVASQVRGEILPDGLADAGVDPDLLGADRFSNG